ncbi:MAG: hypothetical protein M3N16_02220 [Actinomycetota bacterium]|nr:hypothetical protein [Actinomycetota bacterium]
MLAIVSGVVAGLVAGLAMLAWQMTIGGLASEPTAEPGIGTSVFTMPRSVPAFFFGIDIFGDEYARSALTGAAVHLVVAAGFGAVGMGLLAVLLGPRPASGPALLLGALYGVVLQLVVLELFVGGIQEVETVASSTPAWSWWVAHFLYGLVLALVGAAMLRRIGPAAPAAMDGRASG